MATIDTVGGRFDADLLNQQWSRVLDILALSRADASQIITTTPTEFNYQFADFFGNLFVVGARGAGFTYDTLREVQTGTITDLVFTQITQNNPTNNYSTDLNDISLSVADFRAGTFGETVISGNDTTFIQYGAGNFGVAVSDVDTGGGNDTVQFVDGNPLLPKSPAVIDTGAGNDIVALPSSGPSINTTLGAGADIVNLAGVGTSLFGVPRHVITDFDSAADQINLGPSLLLGREWGLAATGPTSVLVQSFDANGGNVVTHAVLNGVGPGDIVLQNDTIVGAPPPPPTAPEVGTDGPDVLIGDAAPNTLVGLGGNDVLLGRQANDVLIGGDGDDAIDGEGGDDQLFGEAGNDTLFGNIGNDVLFGGGGNDILFGNEGDDGIFAGLGSDIVDAGAGNDYIEGTAGFNELTGGTGNDQILGGSDTDIVNAGDGDDVVAGGLGNDVLRGDAGNDTINGGAGDDSIDGALGNDRLSGDEGNDTLFGGAGADILDGGAGNDTIFGGVDSDFIRAGAGTDIIAGEAGGDAAAFGTNDGFNFWLDFEDGTDSLIFNGDLTTSEPQIFSTLDGTGTYIAFGQTEIILEGIESGLIDNNDFVVSLPSVTNVSVAEIDTTLEADVA